MPWSALQPWCGKTVDHLLPALRRKLHAREMKPPVIIGPDDGGRGQRGEMPCTCPLGRCVLRFDLRNCHMADGIGARDLGQPLLAARQARQNLPLLMFGQLRRPSHMDPSLLSAASVFLRRGATNLRRGSVCSRVFLAPVQRPTILLADVKSHVSYHAAADDWLENRS